MSRAHVAVASSTGRPRGRPRGGKAWNKGLVMGEVTREKMREAARRRWQSEEYRERVCSSLRGRAAWNRGISPSAETRKKQSEASKGRIVSEETRGKISRALTGRKVSEETRRKISAACSGQPKSASTKRAISEKKKLQEKEQSTQRIMEAVRMQAASRIRCGQLPNRHKEGILASYEQRLLAYKKLKKELAPWSEAFQEENGRIPGMKDVEATQIPWLIRTYKSYMFLRIQVFQETQQLRDALDMPARQRKKQQKKGLGLSGVARDALTALSSARAYRDKREWEAAIQVRTEEMKPARDLDPDDPTAIINAAFGKVVPQSTDAHVKGGEDDPTARVSAAFASASSYKNKQQSSLSSIADQAADPTGRLGAAFQKAAAYRAERTKEEDSQEPSSPESLVQQAAMTDPTGRLAAAFSKAAAYKAAHAKQNDKKSQGEEEEPSVKNSTPGEVVEEREKQKKPTPESMVQQAALSDPTGRLAAAFSKAAAYQAARAGKKDEGQ